MADEKVPERSESSTTAPGRHRLTKAVIVVAAILFAMNSGIDLWRKMAEPATVPIAAAALPAAVDAVPVPVVAQLVNPIAIPDPPPFTEVEPIVVAKPNQPPAAPPARDLDQEARDLAAARAEVASRSMSDTPALLRGQPGDPGFIKTVDGDVTSLMFPPHAGPRYVRLSGAMFGPSKECRELNKASWNVGLQSELRRRSYGGPGCGNPDKYQVLPPSEEPVSSGESNPSFE